jgi:uncharacterized membrane protein
MKKIWEVSADPTYSPKNLVLSGITSFITFVLAVTGYFIVITLFYPRHPHYASPEPMDMISLAVSCLVAYGFAAFLTFQLRRLLTEYIPAWIFSSFIGAAILLWPIYLMSFYEIEAGNYSGCGTYSGAPPQNWRMFLVSVLISLILFCITSTFSGVVTHLFSARRNTILGLR